MTIPSALSADEEKQINEIMKLVQEKQASGEKLTPDELSMLVQGLFTLLQQYINSLNELFMETIKRI